MNGKWPAVVKSYDQDTREVRVEIPGVTDGADVLPLAQIEYSIGDKSASSAHPTEVEILVGDDVWVEFERGDARYPIITGYRNPRTGNSKDWRRWHHANIELNAGSDEVGIIYLKAGAEVHVVAKKIFTESEELIAHCTTAVVEAEESVAVTAGTTATVTATDGITLDAPTTTVKHALVVQGLLTYSAGMQGSGGSGGASASISGNVHVTGGDVTVDGIGSKSHHHTEHDGPPTSNAQA